MSKRSRPEGHAQHRAHTFAAGAKSSGPGAGWAAQQKYQIGKVVNVPRAMAQLAHLAQREIKYCDNAVTATNFRISSTPPVAVYIGGPVQGAAPYQRIGSKIMNKSLHMRGIITCNATSLEDLGRIIVVYDRQADGAAPAFADLIKATTAAGATSSGAMDGVNMDNRLRFKVLVDEQIRFPAVTNAAGAGVLTNSGNQFDATGNASAAKWNFERYIRLPEGVVTHYKATAGGIGDVATGSIVLFCVSYDQDACWAFDWSCRLRFDDL